MIPVTIQRREPDEPRYTMAEFVQMMRSLGAAGPAMNTAESASGDPYRPDEMGQFHCDPNDPMCRHAMQQAGQDPTQIEGGGGPPPPPIGPIHPGHPQGPLPSMGPQGGNGAAETEEERRRRMAAQAGRTPLSNLFINPAGLAIVRSLGAQPL